MCDECCSLVSPPPSARTSNLHHMGISFSFLLYASHADHGLFFILWMSDDCIAWETIPGVLIGRIYSGHMTFLFFLFLLFLYRICDSRAYSPSAILTSPLSFFAYLSKEERVSSSRYHSCLLCFFGHSAFYMLPRYSGCACGLSRIVMFGLIALDSFLKSYSLNASRLERRPMLIIWNSPGETGTQI